MNLFAFAVILLWSFCLAETKVQSVPHIITKRGSSLAGVVPGIQDPFLPTKTDRLNSPSAVAAGTMLKSKDCVDVIQKINNTKFPDGHLTSNYCDRTIMESYLKTSIRNWVNVQNEKPIKHYVYRKTAAGQSMPLHVKAELADCSSMRSTDPARFNFDGINTKWSTNQMDYMNARKGNDERGHLIAAQLCGPAKWYNMAPQTKQVNRNMGKFSNWIINENNFNKFLKTCQKGNIDLDVLVHYEGNNNRPAGFSMCYTLLDEGNRIVLDRGAYFNNL